jgi:hypothetical protein
MTKEDRMMTKEERAFFDPQIEADVRPWLPVEGGVGRVFALEMVWLIRWALQAVRLGRIDGRHSFWIASNAEFTRERLFKNGIAPDLLYEFTGAEELLRALELVTRTPGTIVILEVPHLLTELLPAEHAFELRSLLHNRQALLLLLTEVESEGAASRIYENDHVSHGDLWKTFVGPVTFV